MENNSIPFKTCYVSQTEITSKCKLLTHSKEQFQNIFEKCLKIRSVYSTNTFQVLKMFLSVLFIAKKYKLENIWKTLNVSYFTTFSKNVKDSNLSSIWKLLVYFRKH